MTAKVSPFIGYQGAHVPLADNPWRFTPASLAGLKVWLDGATLAPAAGAAIASWPDASGNGNTGAVANSPAPVVSTTLLNGKKVVRFRMSNGSIWGNSGLTGATLTHFTILYMGRMIGPDSGGRVFSSVVPTQNYLVGFHHDGYERMYDNGWVPNTLGTYPAFPTPWKVYGSDAEGALSRFFVNGALMGSTPSGLGMTTDYVLSGSNPYDFAETCDCEVAELIIYDHKLTDADRQQLVGYLRIKWGV